MNKNKIIKKISLALLLAAFIIPVNLMAQDPSDPGGYGTGTGGGDCSDPDSLGCPVDGGTIAIVIAGLSIGTFMMMRKKNIAFYQSTNVSK